MSDSESLPDLILTTDSDGSQSEDDMYDYVAWTDMTGHPHHRVITQTSPLIILFCILPTTLLTNRYLFTVNQEPPPALFTVTHEPVPAQAPASAPAHDPTPMDTQSAVTVLMAALSINTQPHLDTQSAVTVLMAALSINTQQHRPPPGMFFDL